MTIRIPESEIIRAANEGMDAFIQVFNDAIMEAIGGELNETTMQELNGEQITLLAYIILRNEVMDGGFVQLIHNGYGGFIFLNPFAKAMRLWGNEKSNSRKEPDWRKAESEGNGGIAGSCEDR